MNKSNIDKLSRCPVCGAVSFGCDCVTAYSESQKSHVRTIVKQSLRHADEWCRKYFKKTIMEFIWDEMLEEVEDHGT